MLIFLIAPVFQFGKELYYLKYSYLCQFFKNIQIRCNCIRKLLPKNHNKYKCCYYLSFLKVCLPTKNIYVAITFVSQNCFRDLITFGEEQAITHRQFSVTLSQSAVCQSTRKHKSTFTNRECGLAIKENIQITFSGQKIRYDSPFNHCDEIRGRRQEIDIHDKSILTSECYYQYKSCGIHNDLKTSSYNKGCAIDSAWPTCY